MAYAAVERAPLAAATKNVYRNTLELLGEALDFNPASVADFSRGVAGAEACYDVIKKRWPVHSTRTRVLTVLLAALRLSHARVSAKDLTIYKHVHHILTRNTSRKRGAMTPRERAGWVTHAETTAAVERLAREAPGSPEHLLLAMYTLWPPNRADYGAVRLYRSESDMPKALRPWAQLKAPKGNGLLVGGSVPSRWGGDARSHVPTYVRDPSAPTENFLVVHPTTPGEWRGPGPVPQRYINFGESPRLVLNAHKTRNSHGRILRVMPPVLARVLAESLAARPREWLFETTRGKPFRDSHAFTVWAGRTFKRIFGRPVGTNTLRHSYISAINFNDSDASTLARVARDMGHSSAMQKVYVLREKSKRRRTSEDADGWGGPVGVVFRRTGTRRGVDGEVDVSGRHAVASGPRSAPRAPRAPRELPQQRHDVERDGEPDGERAQRVRAPKRRLH